MIAYADDVSDKMPHLAMVHENFFNDREPVYLRIHSGSVLPVISGGSRRCDFVANNWTSPWRSPPVKEEWSSTYDRRAEASIINKIKAYQLQDTGPNTIDANIHLGFGSR